MNKTELQKRIEQVLFELVILGVVSVSWKNGRMIYKLVSRP